MHLNYKKVFYSREAENTFRGEILICKVKYKNIWIIIIIIQVFIMWAAATHTNVYLFQNKSTVKVNHYHSLLRRRDTQYNLLKRWQVNSQSTFSPEVIDWTELTLTTTTSGLLLLAASTSTHLLKLVNQESSWDSASIQFHGVAFPTALKSL